MSCHRVAIASAPSTRGAVRLTVDRGPRRGRGAAATAAITRMETRRGDDGEGRRRRLSALSADEEEQPVLPHRVDPLGVELETGGAHRIDELGPGELHGV